MATTLERITKIMVEDLQLPHDEIKPAAMFSDGLGIDSLDAVELLLAVEEEFSIEITDETADGLNTVADLVAVVDRLAGAA